MDHQPTMDHSGQVAKVNPAKKAWTPPRLTVHGALPALTFGATSPKNQE